MKKLGLQKRVEIAWFNATGEDNGWDVFTDMIYKNTQEEIAHKFKVSLRTSVRWHREWRQMSVAQ